MDHKAFIEAVHKAEVSNNIIHKGKLAQAVWQLVDSKYQELKHIMSSGIVGPCETQDIEGMTKTFSQLTERYQVIMENLERINESISDLEKRFSNIETKLESKIVNKKNQGKQELLES